MRFATKNSSRGYLVTDYVVNVRVDLYGVTSWVAHPPTCSIAEASNMGNGVLYLNRVKVKDGLEGLGIGTLMMKSLIKAAKEVGFVKIIVEPGGYSAKGQFKRLRFYRRLGFKWVSKGSYTLSLREILG
jgi:GNAT superfamily N-acetyltransferase